MTFFLSKILWIFFNPINIILFIFFLGFLLRRMKFFKASNTIFVLSFFLFFISGITSTGSYLTFLLEKKYHNKLDFPQNIDGIIILGGATNPYLSKEYNQIIVNGSAERLIESSFLIKKYPNAKIYFAGGSGSLDFSKLSHSTVAKKFYENYNIDTEKFIFDYKSRNTYENILYAKEKFNPKKNENWIVITSAFHLNRAISIGEKLDWKLLPYGTDYRVPKKFKWKISLDFIDNLSNFKFASHEWTGLIAYYMMGRSSKIY